MSIWPDNLRDDRGGAELVLCAAGHGVPRRHTVLSLTPDHVEGAVGPEALAGRPGQALGGGDQPELGHWA